jgi:thiol-disulfide isomerase/thioredoxin
VRRLKFFALLVVGALALTGCTTDTLASQYKDSGDQNYVASDGTVTEIALKNRGKSISFSGTTESGKKVSSSDYAGQVLVVNFWYAGCPPCRAEAGSLEALSKKYAGKDVSFLGVNIYDSADTVLGFEKSYHVTYPSVLDRTTGSVLLAFSGTVPPKATPTTLVIDKKGRVAARILGELQSPDILDTLIQTTLSEKI